MEALHHVCQRPKIGQRYSALAAIVFGPTSVATLVPCRPRDSALVCHMRSFLTLLQTVAGLLVVLLALAVLFAVYAYRNKPQNIEPQGERPDA